MQTRRHSRYCGQSTLLHFLNSAKVGQSLAQDPRGCTMIPLILVRNASPQVALHFDHVDHGVTLQFTETLYRASDGYK